MRRTLLLLATLLAASLLGAQPSHADFAVCTDAYVNTFRQVPRDSSGSRFFWSPGQVDCHEFWRLPFSTPAGTRWIRLIGDADAAGTLPVSNGVERIREAADRATRAMRGLGTYLVDDITMMLSPVQADFTPSIHGATPTGWAIRSQAKVEFAECHVTLMFTAEDNDSASINHVIAHELFHCVQQASLTPEQFASIGGGLGQWWGDGSAELFASLASGERSARYDRTSTFENSVRNRQPLYEQNYGAAIFFFWHFQEKGLDELIPFLRRMAGNGSAAAQRLAMAAALSDDDWVSFAQAYDDRRILHPLGLPLSFGAREEGETWTIASDYSSHERELGLFVIELGWADYSCGTWENETSVQGVEVRRESGREWGPWPQELDTEERALRLRIAAMVTSDDNHQLRLEAEKRESCAGCLVSRAIDRCVVGRWRQTGGGPLEYLRSRGVPITIANQTELVLTMNDDGTFSTNDIDTDVEMEQTMPRGRTMRSTGQGRTGAVSGRWSAEDGELMGCIDEGGAQEGMTTTQVESHVVSSPWGGLDVRGSGGATTYTCSDTTFTTSAPTEHGPMEYRFTRMSPPPRGRR